MKVYKTTMINKIKAKSVLRRVLAGQHKEDAEEDGKGATGALINYLCIPSQKGV
jgi:hypothetical protein